jgi:hypothetical protein
MTESEAIVIIIREIKALASNFVVDNYADAVDEAERETGFVFPATDNFQVSWLIKRTKRALFFSLLSENVESFKFKQINLQDKFKNLKDIVAQMDNEYTIAKEDNPHLFCKVSATQLFGHKVDAGFAYDRFGRDRTYSNKQLVNFTPKEDD